jgi:hypothetical protein
VPLGVVLIVAKFIVINVWLVCILLVDLSQGTKPCKVRLAAAMEFASSLCLMVDDSMSDSAALLWLGQRCAAIECFQHCVIAHGMHGLNYLSSRSSPSSALPLFPSST